MKYVSTMCRHFVGYRDRTVLIVLSVGLKESYILYFDEEHSSTTSVSFRSSLRRRNILNNCAVHGKLIAQ